MRRSPAKFSESDASNHTPSLADFTTTTPELKFSVHTGSRVWIRTEPCPGGFLCLSLACAPERYHANSEYTPRWPRVQPFSALPGLARLSRRMQECETRFRLSSSTCGSLPEALPRHRQGVPSSTQLIQAEKPPQLRSSPFPPLATLRPS